MSEIANISEVASSNADFLMRSEVLESPDQTGSRRSFSKGFSGSTGAKLIGVGEQSLLALGLLGSYSLFFFSLYWAGKFDASPVNVALAFAIWLAGCLALLRNTELPANRARSVTRPDLLVALWCNGGIVAVATLLGGEMRLLLLVGVVFGLLYSGLQFSEGRVRSVMLGTMLCYGICVALKSTVTPLVLEFEILCAMGLAVMLFAASLVAREIIRLRAEARARNRQLATALRRVEELALRDELTGLYNRRHFLDFAGRAIAARERGGPSFVLAYCDLDHFKRVNDRFGHECGDRLLKSFSDAASRSVRTNDLVARLGGEEFVLVLVDADESEASDILERLRMRTASLNVSSAEPTYKVTLSAGLASYREDDTVESMLRRADGALYEAKEKGRDRLVRA